jgi:aspartate beta-hydroxylase
LARVARCLRIYLNEEQAISPDPRQQPTFLYFPDLPATPYFDCSTFAWLERFESLSTAIHSELLQLLPTSSGRERVFDGDDIEQQSMRGTNAAPSWNGYYFYRHGERRTSNCLTCPITIGALDTLPLSRIREHSPEVFFSVFSPGTHLLPHRGVTNTRVVGHLPLIVPNDCALKVGGEVHHWQEGKVVVFDDTYEHEAWNYSQHTRVVLIFDLWNPWLSAIECAALAELVAAIGDFRKAVDAT